MNINKISDLSSRAIGALTKSKKVQSFSNKFNKNYEAALAASTVASIIIKDGLGCAMYVTQSLNNKEIPEEKRSFVSALDLTNGLLMIVAQIGLFCAMRKFSEPIFNKVFSNSFNKTNAKHIASRIRVNQIKEGETPSRKIEIYKAYKKVRQDALDLFKFVVDIGAATIVGKRILVPFIATPLAGKVENKMKHKDQTASENNEPNKDRSNPSMEGNPNNKTLPEVYTGKVTTPNWFKKVS